MKFSTRIILFSILYFILLLNYSAQEFSNQISSSDEKLARKTVKNWCVAHEKWDFKTLKNLYADTLMFYTQKLPVSKVLSKITNMFRPTEVFKHKLISDIDLKLLANDLVKCNFTKEVTIKGKTRSYPSYLVLQKHNDKYLVVAEGDYITDKNLNFDYEESLSASPMGVKKQLASGSYTWLYICIAIILICVALFFYVKKKAKSLDKVEEPISTKEEKIKKPIINESPLSEFEVNKQKGDEFEKYVVSKFSTRYFRSKAWRSDKTAHGHFPESNKYPDLEFEFKHNDYKAMFAVECKYRSNYNGGYIELGDNYKLENYKRFEREKNMQVYIVVGVGGKPSEPEDLYLIALPHLNSNRIHKDQLTKNHFKSVNANFFYDTYIDTLT